MDRGRGGGAGMVKRQRLPEEVTEEKAADSELEEEPSRQDPAVLAAPIKNIWQLHEFDLSH
jgi:hypothetical protein